MRYREERGQRVHGQADRRQRYADLLVAKVSTYQKYSVKKDRLLNLNSEK